MTEIATSKELEPGNWLISLAGTLDDTREDALADALARSATARAVRVGLDLGGVHAINGGGLALLVRFGAWCRDQRQRLSLFHLTPRAHRVFAEQGLGAAMSLHLGDPHGETGASAPDRELCPPEQWACKLGRVPACGPDGDPLPVNVAGRVATTPMDGFGELWHKVYRQRLGGITVTPEEAADYLHTNLGDLWPPGNHLRVVGEHRQLVPGAVGHIQLRLPGGAPLSTGVRVLHRSQTSLTLATLAGHMESGWITFSARDAGGTTVVQVESLARTGDPMYELGFKLLGHGQQEGFWRHTLTTLAGNLGVPPRVQVLRTCVDRSRNWDATRNLAANAAVRTTTLSLLRLFRRGKP